MAQSGGYYEDQAMQSAATGTGNGTAMGLRGPGGGVLTTAVLQVTGISGDTITVEATLDGTNWATLAMTKLADGTTVTTITANGLYRAVCHGLEQVRARVSAYSAGTITVLGRACA